MHPHDIRALRAQAARRTRPQTPWLLTALEWTLIQVSKAPRPMRTPLLYAVMVLTDVLLPVRLLLFQEMMYDRLYPESVQR